MSEKLHTQNFYISQISWTNSSNQEKRRVTPSRLAKSTTFSFQMMKKNMVEQRKCPSWKPRDSTHLQRTQQHQSHTRTTHQTPPSVDTTVTTHSPQMSVKMTHELLTVLWTIPKIPKTVQVNLCRTRHQTTPIWTCLCLYHLTAVRQKLQVLRRRAMLRNIPRLYQSLTSVTYQQQVC